jgi:hypothetical protein
MSGRVERWTGCAATSSPSVRNPLRPARARAAPGHRAAALSEPVKVPADGSQVRLQCQLSMAMDMRKSPAASLTLDGLHEPRSDGPGMGDGGSYNDCKGAGIDGRARLIGGVDATLGKHRKRESADELRYEL